MRKLILAVDDDPEMLNLLKRMVAGKGYLILCKPSAEDALNLMKSINIDLFIVDIMMPNIDGFELCRRIRRNDTLKNKPIVMLSARDSKAIRQQATSAGADTFISKRNMVSTLLSTVNDIFSSENQVCYS